MANLPTPADEPVVYVGGIAGFIAALAVVLQQNHILNLSAETVTAVTTLALIIGPPILALIQRQFVTPVTRVEGDDE